MQCTLQKNTPLAPQALFHVLFALIYCELENVLLVVALHYNQGSTLWCAFS